MDSLHEFCGLCRQRDGEPAALAGAALGGDRAAVQLHNALAQCQTKFAPVAAAVGVEALCDRESKAFRESVIAYTQSRETILSGLLEKPQLLRLPIVRCGRLATVGYCPEVWTQWIEKKLV